MNSINDFFVKLPVNLFCVGEKFEGKIIKAACLFFAPILLGSAIAFTVSLVLTGIIMAVSFAVSCAAMAIFLYLSQNNSEPETSPQDQDTSGPAPPIDPVPPGQHTGVQNSIDSRAFESTLIPDDFGNSF